MSFQNFLRLAQQNQARNDNKIKKISDELKRKREHFINERKAIEEANKRRKPIPPFISQNKSTEYGSLNTSHGSSLKADAPSESGNQSSVVYIPTPIPKKRSSSLMDALEEMNGGSPIPSSLKKRRITVKIPKVASLNPSQSLNNQKQSRNPRRGHIDASNGNFIPPNGVNPAAIASTYLNSSKTGIHSSDPKRQIASKAKAPVQKTGDTSIQRIAYKHKTPQLSTSSLVNANRSVSLNSFSTNKLLIHPPTIPSNVSLHSKPASAAPAQHRSNNSLRPVHSDLKTVQRPARPASQPPSGNVANMPRPLGIAAQLGLPRSRVESALASLSSVRKTSLDSVNSISKAISPSNGKSSLRLAALPFNDQRRLPTIMEPPVKQPGLQPRMTMERPRAVVPTVRGIAAQYGSLPTASSGRSPNSYLDDESDEYASDDSFIDDTDCTSAKDYLRAVKDIHKSLHFDPNKYAKISKYDNLASMESSYRQIEKEEKLSMRLGAREDQEDMAMEAERRRRRMAKRL